MFSCDTSIEKKEQINIEKLKFSSFFKWVEYVFFINWIGITTRITQIIIGRHSEHAQQGIALVAISYGGARVTTRSLGANQFDELKH